MHVIQEIGAYAGLAAMVGLAVLSALYFSQARDVKRLREWAGRAPERAAERAGRAVAPSRPGQPPPQGAPPPGAAPAVAIPAVEQAPPSSNARPAAPPGRPPAAGGAAPPRTAARPGCSRATTSRPFSRAPAEPWYRRVLRGRPEYLVLAVTGVLIIGGALAFAVSQVGG